MLDFGGQWTNFEWYKNSNIDLSHDIIFIHKYNMVDECTEKKNDS